jgi:hypothetical protein
MARHYGKGTAQTSVGKSYRPCIMSRFMSRLAAATQKYSLIINANASHSSRHEQDS